jgi:hypothetical protein
MFSQTHTYIEGLPWIYLLGDKNKKIIFFKLLLLQYFLFLTIIILKVEIVNIIKQKLKKRNSNIFKSGRKESAYFPLNNQ